MNAETQVQYTPSQLTRIVVVVNYVSSGADAFVRTHFAGSGYVRPCVTELYILSRSPYRYWSPVMSNTRVTFLNVHMQCQSLKVSKQFAFLYI